VLEIWKPVDGSRTGASQKVRMRDDIKPVTTDQGSYKEFGSKELSKGAPSHPERMSGLKQFGSNYDDVWPANEHHVQNALVDVCGYY